MKNEINLRVKFSGEAGDGIITAGTIFMETVSKLGYEVSIHKTFPSNLRSGYSMSLVTVSNNKIYSPTGLADVLISFNEEYLERDLNDLMKLDTLIIDPKNNEKISDKYKSLISKKTENFYTIPFSKLAMKYTGLFFTKNIIALGVTSYIFNIPKQLFIDCIEKKMKNREKNIVELNLKAFDIGLNWANKYYENK